VGQRILSQVCGLVGLAHRASRFGIVQEDKRVCGAGVDTPGSALAPRSGARRGEVPAQPAPLPMLSPTLLGL